MRTPWREVENIVEEWQRNPGATANRGWPAAAAVWDDGALEEARLRNSELITAAGPVLGELKQLLAGTGQVVALCDPDGRALMVEGEAAALRAAEQVRLVPGSNWRLRPWESAAAPIRASATGDLVGILNLSGEFMNVNPHTEIAVAGAARAIESRLALLESTYANLLLEAYTEQLGSLRGRLASAGVVDRRGRLVRSSGGGLDQLAGTAEWAGAVQQALLIGREDQVLVDKAAGRCVLTVRPVSLSGWTVGAVVVAHPAQPPRLSGHPLQLAVKGLVGSNPAWVAALDRGAKAARTDAAVLITGETGTGKELLARSIHRASSRSGGPFVAVNCGAIPAGLMASELFGYVGGAFTGASPRGSTGKVEAANGGTLFLDEVSELSPEAQVHLLRVLQEKEVVRVGGHSAIPVSVRVVAATNRNLQEMVTRGAFRSDLFYRLHVVPVVLPPLRERRDDILPLMEYGYRRLGQEPPDLSLPSCERLMSYHWPGNVRELLNLVEQAVVLGEDPADLLPLPALKAAEPRSLGEAGEEDRIRRVLAECAGNAAAAARQLGWSRSTLYRKLELYGIRLGRQVQPAQ